MTPTVSLGSVLARSDSWIELDPLKNYTELTVHLWGRGVSTRRVVEGSEIAGQRRLKVMSGEFVVSRIDVRHGAFAVIPDQLDGAIVSNDFPTFRPNQEQLLPEYLGWLSRTHDFVDSCRSASEGTTNRVRLKEDKFAQIEIPLPPLAEQRRIVAKIERLAAKIDEARGQKAFADEDVEAQVQAGRRALIGSEPTSDWSTLEEVVVDIENGWSPACHNHLAVDGNWGVIKVGAVSFGKFNATENKELPEAFQPRPDLEIEPASFL